MLFGAVHPVVPFFLRSGSGDVQVQLLGDLGLHGVNFVEAPILPPMVEDLFHDLVHGSHRLVIVREGMSTSWQRQLIP